MRHPCTTARFSASFALAKPRSKIRTSIHRNAAIDLLEQAPPAAEGGAALPSGRIDARRNAARSGARTAYPAPEADRRGTSVVYESRRCAESGGLPAPVRLHDLGST